MRVFRNGFAVLFSSVVIQICLGGIYAWSAFSPALHDVYGLGMGQAQLIFGVCYTAFPLSMTVSGRLLNRFGPRPVTAAGGLFFIVGYGLASISNGGMALLLFGFGILGGTAIGFGYVSPIAVSVRWFPHRQGLVTGVTVAGFGGGAILLSQLAGFFFSKGWDVLDIFRWVGIGYGAIIIFASMFLIEPEDSAPKVISSQDDSQTVFDTRLKILLGGIFSGTFSGLLIVGNLKPIGLSFGCGDVVATWAISLFAVGNAGSRIFWGWFFDRVDEWTIPISLLLMSFAAIFMCAGGLGNWGYLAGTVLAGAGFGACFVVYAAAVTRAYGSARFGHIYPLVFLGCALSGITGPGAGGWIFDWTGTYIPALVVAAGVPLAGAAISGVFQWQRNRRI